MKRLVLFCCFGLFFFIGHGYGQYRHEWSVFMGVANYQGDLPEPHLELVESRLAGGLIYRYHWHPKWAVRAQVIRGRISGDDANADSRNSRKFRFSAPIMESAIGLEWKPFGRRSLYYVGKFRPHIGPYLYAGVGVAYARPVAVCYRTDMPPEFDPFAGEMRQSWFLAVPYGVGLRVDATPRWSVGLEVGQRPVFSDLLDGVSATANSGKDDWYVFSGLTISWRIGTSRFRDVNAE